MMLWLIGAVVIVAVAMLVLLSRKPYVVTRAQFEDTLNRAVQRKISGHEWDTFLRIPIGSDSYLDSLRERLLKLETAENLSGAEEGALYNSTVLQNVAAALDELRSKKA
jgi:hypothetical protein